MRPYSPGGALIAFAPAREGSIPPTPSAHRLRPGLPGYLIPFATLAFEPQRQSQSRRPPSPLVFFPISTHFTATLGIPPPSPALKEGSSLPNTGLSPAFSGCAFPSACAPFTPNDSGQRSPPTCYRGCWHVVSRGFLVRYRPRWRISSPPPSSPTAELYNPRAFSLTRRCSVRLSPIAEDSPLLPPVGVWAVSQSQCGRSLGRVSVPMWPFILSDRLPIVALVVPCTAN